MERFSSRKLTRKEKLVKREVDTYHVSDVDNTAAIYVGSKALNVYQSIDLPDAECDGLTFKRRVVQTGKSTCLLLARWKPERHLRRTTTEWSQKWFVEKRLFPTNTERFFAKLERQVREAQEAAENEKAKEQSKKR